MCHVIIRTSATGNGFASLFLVAGGLLSTDALLDGLPRVGFSGVFLV